ncbi:MAG TPA: hypothetical protein VFG09_05840 [Thermodesulfovibrionales bacterium]|nr:hypothetical protein [Thermodesulfovibrionales bacterium]
MDMKRSALLAAVLCLFTVSVASATHTGDGGSDGKKARFTKHFNETLFQISEKGEFSVEVLLDDKEYPKLGKNVIGIVIHNKHDQDVEGADITLSLLSDGQDVTGSPFVKEKGDGLYTVADLDLSKERKGELRVKIRQKEVQDTAVFVLPSALKERFPAGRYTE